jgi:dolichol-phosphate mannosyltransferase
MHAAIIIPTYNEVANIPTLLTGIRESAQHVSELTIEVVIVDDQSPDGTSDQARQLAKELENDRFTVTVLDKPVKEGFGAACVYGYTNVLDRAERPDYLIQMDADLSHSPRYIPGLVHAAQRGAEFVNASRYLPGGGTPDWTWDRRFLSRGGNFYSRAMLGRRVTDYTGGFALYTADLLERIDVRHIDSNGYGFQLVLKKRASDAARTFAEIPIVFMDREHGSSKLPKNTLLVNFLLVLKMRLARSGSTAAK